MTEAGKSGPASGAPAPIRRIGALVRARADEVTPSIEHDDCAGNRKLLGL